MSGGLAASDVDSGAVSGINGVGGVCNSAVGSVGGSVGGTVSGDGEETEVGVVSKYSEKVIDTCGGGDAVRVDGVYVRAGNVFS